MGREEPWNLTYMAIGNEVHSALPSQPLEAHSHLQHHVDPSGHAEYAFSHTGKLCISDADKIQQASYQGQS